MYYFLSNLLQPFFLSFTEFMNNLANRTLEMEDEKSALYFQSLFDY